MLNSGLAGSLFRPAWWLPGPHLQTLWGKFLRRQPPQPTRLERLETPDADFVDIHHLDAADPGSPTLILLHGLEGTIRSHYIQGLLHHARRRGWRAAVLIFRSCGTEMNRARRFYHSGETSDLSLVVGTLASRHPDSPIVLAGASLGGNVLLKFLATDAERWKTRIRAAAAISVPFDLARSSRHINKGFSRVYERHFLRSLKKKAAAKLERYPELCLPEKIALSSTMFDFDDAFTAPVHGFADATDYYTRSSSIPALSRISTKTLLLSAVDDPFLPAEVLAEVARIAARNPALHAEFHKHGGHVGFITGKTPWHARYYLEHRVGDFLAQWLSQHPDRFSGEAWLPHPYT